MERKKQNVLIVDDRPETLSALESLLAAPGVTIVKASCANEALGALQERDFCVILLDLRMSEKDGFKTATSIRELESTRFTPIIFLSAISNDKRHLFEGYQAGAVDYLSEPVDPELLKSKVGLFLELDRNRVELVQAMETIERKNLEFEANRAKLENAQDQVSNLIQRVASGKGFGVRFENPDLARCYEMLQCGNVDCPCHGKEAQRCWQVAGTFCLSTPTGSFAEKQACCAQCPVFLHASEDQGYRVGEYFNNMMHILELNHQDLEKAYSELKTMHSQILQQEKMASIGQLAAGVAHEINNPAGFLISNLGTLRKYAERLTDFIQLQAEAMQAQETGDGSATEKLEKTRAAKKSYKIDHILRDVGDLIDESLDGAQRIKSIVENMKGFSRLDEAEYKEADINKGLESTLNIVWNELKYKAAVQKQYGNIPLTVCNLGELNQVFMNILINAAHSIESRGEISVRTWFEGGEIHIVISDTGCGIAPENIRRIFEPFYTTKGAGMGTGLGLSITYDIIKKHKGRIEVESTVGKGTTFNIMIPVMSL